MQPTSVQKQKINQKIGGVQMIQTMKKRIKNEKGLTLVELLAVIVILAIVAAIAVPAIGGIIDNSRYKAVKADAINVINAANIYFTDQTATTVTVKELEDDGYLETAGKIPGTATVIKAPAGLELSVAKVDYGGKYGLAFDGATIKEIEAHTSKKTESVGGGSSVVVTPGG